MLRCVKFTEHRDSMAPLVELADRAALLAHCRRLLSPPHAPVLFQFSDEKLDVTPLATTLAPAWATHRVIIKGYGPVGFTDGPAPP
jgi:hypothetical protein